MSTNHQILSFVTCYDFKFGTENTRKLYDQLNHVDKLLFNFDSSCVRWEPYMHDYVEGIRKYILGETDERLEFDRARYERYFL